MKIISALVSAFFILLQSESRADFPSAVNCPASFLKNGLGNVELFSAIRLENTPLGRSWAQALPELKSKYPQLLFTAPSDLHITVMYFGWGWDPSRVGEMAPYSLLTPDLQNGPVTLSGPPTLYGMNHQVLVLLLNGVPQEWINRVINSQYALNNLGLRKQDYYDGTYEAHITLVTAPDPAHEQDAMNDVLNWVNAEAPALANLSVTFDGNLSTEFLLTMDANYDEDFVPLLSACPPTSRFSQFF